MSDERNVLIELNQYVWSQIRKDLRDLEPQEIDWKPLPQANNLNAIVRHLRIEAQWQLASIEHAEPILLEATPPVQAFIDSISLDFASNLAELERLCTKFIAALCETSLSIMEERNRLVYEGFPGKAPPAHFLGYHHAVHLAMHWGQIRTLRNLYRTSRGQPALFIPDNPTFPKPATW